MSARSLTFVALATSIAVLSANPASAETRDPCEPICKRVCLDIDGDPPIKELPREQDLDGFEPLSAASSLRRAQNCQYTCTRVPDYCNSSTSGTPVPEPGMIGLFGLGLGAAGFAARRRRKTM